MRLTSSNRSNSSELMLPDIFCLTSLRFLSFFLLSLSLSFFSRSRSPVPTPFLMKLNIVTGVCSCRVWAVSRPVRTKGGVDVWTPFDLDLKNSCNGYHVYGHERVLSKTKERIKRPPAVDIYHFIVRRKYPCDCLFLICW